MENSSLNGLLTSLPGRYANTLYEIACQKKGVSHFVEQFKSITDTFSENKELREVIFSPVLTTEEQRSVLKEICRKAGWDDLFVRFFDVLIENGRMELIPEIQRIFQLIDDNHEKKETAEVVSAHSFSESQKKKIISILQSQSKGSLEITFKMDPALLGGFYIRNQSRIIDLTIASRLSNLINAMKGSV